MWSMILCFSVLNLDAKVFSAMAIPTALAIPCPNGPVVVSTPGVIPNSGWPAVFEFNCLKSFKSWIDKS